MSAMAHFPLGGGGGSPQDKYRRFKWSLSNSKSDQLKRMVICHQCTPHDFLSKFGSADLKKDELFQVYETREHLKNSAERDRPYCCDMLKKVRPWETPRYFEAPLHAPIQKLGSCLIGYLKCTVQFGTGPSQGFG